MQQIGFLSKNLLFAQHVSGNIMPIIRSSRVTQMVAACGTLALWYAGRCSGVELWVVCPVCGTSAKVTQAAIICITLELLMMGIMVPETCSANSKFCNKKPI